MARKIRIGIVAGEKSGDILGANLIHHLKILLSETIDAELVVEGIGGPLMIAEGCDSWFAMDRLSVMGLIEPLKRLPELLTIRKTLKQRFIENPPDVFIGIDSPDFNLPLEKKLKQAAIKTVHYVSPSVWAWRQKRIFDIKKSVDLMLTLFPFELEIYQQHHVPVECVGHPLADEIPETTDQQRCQELLGIKTDKRLVALLPGSRESEVTLLAPVFFQAARQCLQSMPDLEFLIPAANAQRKSQLEALLARQDLPVTLFDGQSHEVMGASDLVLMASGTTALEAMSLKKPMVVAYKMAPLSYAIISRLLKAPYISLPNLLAQKEQVPELLQAQATPENIAQHMLDILADGDKQKLLEAEFLVIHQQLKRQAGETAAKAVIGLIG